jgi:diphthine-ammonia ligase
MPRTIRADGYAMTAAVLWTGGKDSALALYRAARLNVTELVTFVPPEAEFRAHDLRLMAAQACAVGLPHRQMIVEPPFDAGYERAFRELRASGIERVISGDIAEVGGHPNFINAPAERAGIELELPLWGVDRHAHLEQIIALGFDVLLTYVNEPWLGPEWVGRRLDAQALAELSALSRDTGLDVAGENGEYHSMVLGGPGWQHALRVEGRTVSAPPAHRLQIMSINAPGGTH